jgi:hypothetical protein
MHRGRVIEDEADLVRLPAAGQGALEAIGHDARAVIQRKSRDACADRWDGDGFDIVVARNAKRRIHRGAQRVRGRAATQRHACGMDDISRAQVARARDRSTANRNGAVRGALILDGGTTTSPNRAGDSATEEQVVVGGVDNRVDLLLDQIAGDDQDARRRDFLTSATRSSSSLRVAAAMPRSPMSEIVSDAHATPHIKDS